MTSNTFSAAALRVLIASVIVHLMQFVTQIPVLIAIGNLCSLVYLRHTAMALARAERDDFDAVIAAEVMVAFGVLSLIFGLTTSLAPLLATSVALQWDNLRTLSWPFIEGLATAGAAPFFAVVLRLQVFEISRTVDAVDDLAGLAAATRDLTGELKRAGKSASDLQTALHAAGTSTARMAQDVETHGGRFGAALIEGQGHVRTLSAAAQAGSVEVNKLAGETDRLTGAAGDSATMLAELSRLIDAVKRFVRPDASHSA